MLFRRVTTHFKEQNWIAFILDFVVVVAGIFIALQVTDYSNQISDKRLITEKLEILIDESKTAPDLLPQVRRRLEAVISSVDRLNQLIQTCTENNEISELLFTMVSISYMGNNLLLDTQSLNQHTSLLGNDFVKSLRKYNSNARNLVLHSQVNSEVNSDMELMRTPYIGMQINPKQFVLTQSMASLCQEPEFIKLVNIPKILAEIELELQTSMLEVNAEFVRSIETELKKLNGN